LLTLGLLMLVILAGPYRRGERWAWWAMWLLPIWALSVPATFLVYGLAPGAPPAPPLISGSIIGAICVVVLLVDRRRFDTRRAVDEATARGRARGGTLPT
jgi:hypothetical protein